MQSPCPVPGGGLLMTAHSKGKTREHNRSRAIGWNRTRKAASPKAIAAATA